MAETMDPVLPELSPWEPRGCPAMAADSRRMLYSLSDTRGQRGFLSLLCRSPWWRVGPQQLHLPFSLRGTRRPCWSLTAEEALQRKEKRRGGHGNCGWQALKHSWQQSSVYLDPGWQSLRSSVIFRGGGNGNFLWIALWPWCWDSNERFQRERSLVVALWAHAKPLPILTGQCGRTVEDRQWLWGSVACCRPSDVVTAPLVSPQRSDCFAVSLQYVLFALFGYIAPHNFFPLYFFPGLSPVLLPWFPFPYDFSISNTCLLQFISYVHVPFLFHPTYPL